MMSNKGAVMSRLVSPFVDFFIVRYLTCCGHFVLKLTLQGLLTEESRVA